MRPLMENWPSCKGYSPCKIVTLGTKIKIPKNMSKSILRNRLEWCVCKNPLEKTLKYPRNECIIKIGHHAKAIAHAKYSLWVKN